MKKLRWGLIGCGDISRKRVAPAIKSLDQCKLVAVARANHALAESFAKEFNAKRWYRNWQDLINDDEIDAVYLATPVYLHAEQTIAAAKEGKHVLCEKPMALNAKGCERMIEICKKNNVTLGVAYYRHFYPVINRVKEIILSGEIGEPTVVEVQAFEWFDRKPGEPRYWLLEKEKSGGGPMMDFGVTGSKFFKIFLEALRKYNRSCLTYTLKGKLRILRMFLYHLRIVPRQLSG